MSSIPAHCVCRLLHGIHQDHELLPNPTVLEIVVVLYNNECSPTYLLLRKMRSALCAALKNTA